MMFKGYSSTDRNKKFGALDVDAIYPTIQAISEKRNGLEVYSNFYHQRIVQGDIVEDVLVVPDENQTIVGIQATGHSAKRGDLIRFTSGTSQYREIKVYKVKDANNFYLSEEVPAGEIVATNTFDILRATQPRVTSDGDLIVSVASETFDPEGDNYINADLSLSNIPNGSDTNIITATAEIVQIHIENQSGFNFNLKKDGSTVFLIPKGFSGLIDFYSCPIGTVIALESYAGNANSGQITINTFKRP